MSTTAHEARRLARRWVSEEEGSLPGFHGAYFAGSVNALPDDAVLPATSDLDINVVLAGGQVPTERKKFLYGGVLLEISYLPLQRVQGPEQVLGDYHLAGAFSAPGIIADPTGHLAALQQQVARDFGRREWVQRRCEQARSRVLDGLASVHPSRPLHEQAMGWLFPTGVTTHILLAAARRNPTVRRRYAAVRELLAEHGRLDLHETLLELLGCVHLTRDHVQEHLAALVPAFDAAAAALATPFPFASDITPIARPVAIHGSRELIEQGLHREAVFWIAVTASRCRAVVAADAPGEAPQFEEPYQTLLADLGIGSFAAMQERSERVRAALPAIWA